MSTCRLQVVVTAPGDARVAGCALYELVHGKSPKGLQVGSSQKYSACSRFSTTTITLFTPRFVPPGSVALPRMVTLNSWRVPFGKWITWFSVGAVMTVSGESPVASANTFADAGVGSCWPPESTPSAYTVKLPPSGLIGNDPDQSVVAAPGDAKVAVFCANTVSHAPEDAFHHRRAFSSCTAYSTWSTAELSLAVPVTVSEPWGLSTVDPSAGEVMVVAGAPLDAPPGVKA